MTHFGEHFEVVWIWGARVFILYLFILIISVAVEAMKEFLKNA
jgi:hypothetical protein